MQRQSPQCPLEGPSDQAEETGAVEETRTPETTGTSTEEAGTAQSCDKPIPEALDTILIEEKTYSCPCCKSLNTITRTIIGREKEYVCSACNYPFRIEPKSNEPIGCLENSLHYRSKVSSFLMMAGKIFLGLCVALFLASLINKEGNTSTGWIVVFLEVGLASLILGFLWDKLYRIYWALMFMAKRK